MNLQHYCDYEKLKALYGLEVYDIQIELDETIKKVEKLKIINDPKKADEKDEIIKILVKDFGLKYNYFKSI